MSLFDPKLERADAEFVARLERNFGADLFFVDVGAVAAAQIAHRPPGVAMDDRAVSTTDCFAARAQRTFLGAPDEELVLLQRDFETFFGAGEYD